MIRACLLLVVLLMRSAHADAAAPLDRARLAAVYDEALTFVAPRVLAPVAPRDLALWGLQGLGAGDPALRVVLREGTLRLFRNETQVMRRPAPADTDTQAWARAAVALTAAAYGVSPRLARAGTQAVIAGFFGEMFSRLDPYSRYVPPADAGADRESRAGRAGPGLAVARRGRHVVVADVIRGGPAAASGIRAGDRLVSVDARRLATLDEAAVTALLEGPEGSEVSIVWRSRGRGLRRARMTRLVVPPETVYPRRLGSALLLKVTGFSRSTAEHVARRVREALARPDPVDGIVLDLRDNRGGLLRQAVAAADTFLPAGLVATAVGRDPDASNTWQSTEGELAENMPLVVLVNGMTASAAEVVAAALADRGRAVVVGSVTVGKGLVQTIDPLPDGGELFVTWSQLLAPLGWPLQGPGVMPQVCTSLGADALRRQFNALAAGKPAMAEALRRSRTARLPLSAGQVLAIRAPCPAASGSPLDLEAARMLIGNPALYASALLPPMPGPDGATTPGAGAPSAGAPSAGAPGAGAPGAGLSGAGGR